MTIPTSPMNRALTDKERKAVKAEALRLRHMLDDDSMYWRRGLTPPPPQPKEHYDINRLFIEREDLWLRTKLPKGDPQRLTLPAAKREAQKAHCYPPGLVETGADGKLVMLITGGVAYHGEAAKLVADRYIQRLAA